MACIQIFVLFFVFFFGNSQCEHSNLSKHYEYSVNNLITKDLKGIFVWNLEKWYTFLQVLFFTFSDTKYCPTILLPTEHTLKKSLDSILFNSKSGTIPNKIDRIDLCCRTLYKCNLQKTSEINQTVWYIRHCNCVQSFQHCLKSLNTSLSNELYSTFALNATKCISNEQKIVVVSFNASLRGN